MYNQDRTKQIIWKIVLITGTDNSHDSLTKHRPTILASRPYWAQTVSAVKQKFLIREIFMSDRDFSVYKKREQISRIENCISFSTCSSTTRIHFSQRELMPRKFSVDRFSSGVNNTRTANSLFVYQSNILLLLSVWTTNCAWRLLYMSGFYTFIQKTWTPHAVPWTH